MKKMRARQYDWVHQLVVLLADFNNFLVGRLRSFHHLFFFFPEAVGMASHFQVKSLEITAALEEELVLVACRSPLPLSSPSK